MPIKQSMFTSGWVNESEISLQPENTVRDLLNFRILSDAQNTYSAEIVKGNSILFQLNPGYRPIGWTVQGTKFVVFSTNSTSPTGGNGEVGVVYLNVDTLQAQSPLTSAYVPIYNSPALNFSQLHMIGKEARIQKENEKIERVYWTDNFNPLRALNIANPLINTFILPSSNILSGFLVVGQQYMVLQGRVEYPVGSGVFYGPNELTNLFTALLGFLTYTITLGPTIVVASTPNVATIDVVPKKALGNIEFTGWSFGGQLPTGDYQIAYQLETSDGFRTNWSYLSQGTHVVVAAQTGSGGVDSLNSINYAKYIGDVAGTITSKCLKWKIIGVDTNFFKLRVAYVATYAYQVPSVPIVFWESEIAGQSTIDVELCGGENLEILPSSILGGPLEALSVQSADILTVKTITTLKNRLFAGNIRAGFDFSFTPVGTTPSVTIKLVEYLVPSDLLSFPTTNGSSRWPFHTDIPAGFAIHGQPDVTWASTIDKFIYKDQWYQVTGGTLEYPVGSGMTYTTGDTFQGIAYEREYIVTAGTPVATAIIKIQKYTGVYEIVPMVNEFTDSKGQMGDFYFRSYWRAETYRTGILLWKTGGQPQFVEFLADKTIPHQYEGTDPATGQVIDMKLAEPELYYHDTAARWLDPNLGSAGPDSEPGLGINMHTSLRQIGLSIEDLDFNPLATSVMGSINANPNGGGSVSAYSLGLASTYVILTGGALTIGLPAQPVTGNVGQTGAITGSIVFISGADFPAPDSSPAVADALALYNQLIALTPTYSFTPGAVVLETEAGHGTPGTYTPGIYKGTGAVGTTANAVVTFDGDGDFVFIFNGAMTTGANTVFKLINGAKASRIFFATSAALTTGDGTILKGTYLSPAGMTTGVNLQLEGRIISTGPAAISTGAGAGTYTLPTDIGVIVSFADLGRFFDGFSIVRVPRDKQILCQGLWYPTVIDGNNTVPQITESLNTGPLGMGVQPFRQDVYNFYSPETQFGLNNDAVVPVAGDFVSVADYLGVDPTIEVTDFPGVLDTNSSHYYHKYYTQQPAGPTDYPKSGFDSQINPAGTFYVDTGQGPTPQTNPFINVNNILPLGGVGTRTLVLTVNKGGFPNLTTGTWPINNNDFTHIKRALVNYIRPKGNLYGGTSNSAKANNFYAYIGHFQRFDSGFLAHLADTAGGKAAGKARGIQVFGGDCFVQMYGMQRIMKNLGTDGISGPGSQISCAVVFPVESSVNANLRYGRFFNKDRNREGSENQQGIWYPTNPEVYLQNGAYSSTFDVPPYVQYPVQPIGFISASQFEHRIIYSLKKIDGEIIDNYRIFMPLNFIDVEGWSGQINNVRSKAGRLFYWQDAAFGYVPVLERVLSTNLTGEPVTLGEGGVATRYDEFRNFFGNQHKHGLAETDDAFYWFDNRRKAFCEATTGGQLIEVSIIKGLRGFLKNTVAGAVTINDNPILGGGIYAEFNGMFKEVVMTFKGVTTGDFIIAYNTLNKHFSGRYSFTPGIMLDFYNHLISIGPDPAGPIVSNTVYNIGDIISQGTINYITILSFTSGIIPTQPLMDPTHFVAINDSNGVWMHNRPTDQISNFYGKVEDAFLVKIMNDNYAVPKVIDTIKQNSDSAFWSSIFYNNNYQVGSDVAIDILTNKDFRYIDRSWFFNVPFEDINQVRLVDGWLSAKFVKDNRAINLISGLPIPTLSKDEILKVVAMIYSYRKTY